MSSPTDRFRHERSLAARRPICRQARAGPPPIQRSGADARTRARGMRLVFGARSGSRGRISRHVAARLRALGSRPSPPTRSDRRRRHQGRSNRALSTTSRRWNIGSAPSCRNAAPRAAQLEWVHFGCTSEDINNLAYALMLKAARDSRCCCRCSMRSRRNARFTRAAARSGRHAGANARTIGHTDHGRQGARQCGRAPAEANATALERVVILGKMNGAVGNFNAHVAALPLLDWRALQRALRRVARRAVRTPTRRRSSRTIGLPSIATRSCAPTPCFSTSRATCGAIFRSAISNRNSWPAKSVPPPCRTRSIPSISKMPRAIWAWRTPCSRTLRTSCPISRLQRDLSDSTVLRNLGVAIGHAALAYQSLTAGLTGSSSMRPGLRRILNSAWEVLGEAVQTVMRAHGIPEAYDRLKAFTRGRHGR